MGRSRLLVRWVEGLRGSAGCPGHGEVTLAKIVCETAPLAEKTEEREAQAQPF